MVPRRHKGHGVGSLIVLIGKAESFAAKVRGNGLLSRNEAWTNMTHTVSKTLECPLAATTLSLKDWDDISTHVNRAALPKAGVVRTFPHSVLCAPTKYQGMGSYMCKWHDQELTHLKLLVEQVQRRTHLGLKFQMTIEQLCLETGHSGPFTDVPWSTVHHLVTPTWQLPLEKLPRIWDQCD